VLPGLVIVGDLDLECIVPMPYEADSILVIDANAVLPPPTADQFLESVPGRRLQIFQRRSAVKHGQFPLGYAGRGRSAGSARPPDFRRVFVGESPDHLVILTCNVNNVNRY
jgi:hypothetical protein